MSFRTVVISSHCKLDLKMGYLVVRAEETRRVFLKEIDILIIENTAVSLTACLLAELVSQKIKVIVCDNQRNPAAELMPLHGCHDSTQKLRAQIAWGKEIKSFWLIWSAM